MQAVICFLFVTSLQLEVVYLVGRVLIHFLQFRADILLRLINPIHNTYIPTQEFGVVPQVLWR